MKVSGVFSLGYDDCGHGYYKKKYYKKHYGGYKKHYGGYKKYYGYKYYKHDDDDDDGLLSDLL